MDTFILRPEWLIDGTGANALSGHAVTVAKGRIDAVTPLDSLQHADDIPLIDLPGKTLIPGLINNHVHLVLPGDNTPFVPWIDLQSDTALTLQATHNGLKSLAAGVTTVRDCGGTRSITLEIRDAQAAGRHYGPRIFACGWTITITGGHTRQFGGEADGTDALTKMVRRVISLGADYVKVMASGGGTPGSLVQFPSFSLEELSTIVETAHSLGRPVCAHCIATGSIENAIAAGVDYIEHASFMDTDTRTKFDHAIAEKLAASGIPVTPTLQVNRDMVDLLPDGPERDVWQHRMDSQRATVHALHELGVPLLAGSDAGWRATDFDTFWKELDELVICGMSPVEAVHAATGAVSQALGVAEEYGTIQTGRVADLVVVDGDLAGDIQRLSKVEAVYQAGTRIDPRSESPR